MYQDMAEWTPQSGNAPLVRVGIILPEDDRTSLQLTVPDAGYNLTSPEGFENSRISSQTLEFTIEDKQVAHNGQRASKWILTSPQADGDQVPCTRVDDVVAGRGFHWHKKISQNLPGNLEISNVEGRILLVCELPMELYMVGVITSEMGSKCPLALLQTQCVVARSWTLAYSERKHTDMGFHYCNDDCCQRFQGLRIDGNVAEKAVESTVGEVLIAPTGVVVDANYSKSCGGISEHPKHLWEIKKPGLSAIVDAPSTSPLTRMIPVDDSRMAEYLTGDWLASCDAYCSPSVVPDTRLTELLGPVDTGEGFFRWSVHYNRQTLEELLKRKVFDRLNVPETERLVQLDDLSVTARGISGRATEILITYKDADGKTRQKPLADQYWIRHALHDSFLYSSAFVVDIDHKDDGTVEAVTFTGAGWGHGAGLCQIGALGMALKGFAYNDILTHYFPEATLRKVYP